MQILAANVAVFDQGRVLLIQRADFEVWALPGGKVEPGESIAQAAIREVREETGLEVRLTRLIGLYSTPGWPDGDQHQVLFAGYVCGGELQLSPAIAHDARYVAAGALPDPLLWGHQQQIDDALAGLSGRVWLQTADLPAALQRSRQELLGQYHGTGLTRQQIYQRLTAQLGPARRTPELESEPPPI